ncbi:hypothetical protein J6590_037237 [Homalodisca vitripennis]|nr:hypothetical protein J6590_037237 [Homalodisca vitripennis]
MPSSLKSFPHTSPAASTALMAFKSHRRSHGHVVSSVGVVTMTALIRSPPEKSRAAPTALVPFKSHSRSHGHVVSSVGIDDPPPVAVLCARSLRSHGNPPLSHLDKLSQSLVGWGSGQTRRDVVTTAPFTSSQSVVVNVVIHPIKRAEHGRRVQTKELGQLLLRLVVCQQVA